MYESNPRFDYIREETKYITNAPQHIGTLPVISPMSIDELGNKELELYHRIQQLEGTIDEKTDKVVYFGISKEYLEIHREYSMLAKDELEALKRGLFIMWYALTEPTWLTGICELDPEAEERIVKLLDRQISKDLLDYELDWMLEYYSDFGFAFERFSNYEHFYRRTSSKTGLKFPESIDRETMALRGQMGEYLNSLNFEQLNNYR
ncbi:hypothetical protein SAMN04488029_1266 [Reichenbachiella faecimaris]|uniref:Uncharacterized protein n=1 Tax=Reichenbachiella faecimaris TaxID=692418 RepID=A0A1W2G9D2_REIFA|nr:hypothetical protein [Reichenbachiella faecimaris]SMD32906.1 hypothetical protein SAMN04488029_1266 [Reichenbachiella faecimaris]